MSSWFMTIASIAEKNTLHAICGFSILSAMLQSSNLHELTKKFKWTHKGVQMNPQRGSNEPTKVFKWTHKEVQMNTQRSSNEHTKGFKWTHKGVQMNTQRGSNEHTKEFKWTHKGVQMNPQRTSNDLQVPRDIAIHRILTIDYHFCSIVPYPLQQGDACSWLQCLTRTLYLQILSSLVRNLKVESWSADLKGNCTVNIFLSICLRLNFCVKHHSEDNIMHKGILKSLRESMAFYIKSGILFHK